MQKEQFQKIMEILTERTDLCQHYLGELLIGEKKLSQFTIEDAASLKRFCVKEEQIMTDMAMVDLYHIIGMGNLAPSQMMKFVYAIKKYLSYRPSIKIIRDNLHSIVYVPDIIVKTKYVSKSFDDIVLTSTSSEIVIDDIARDCEKHIDTVAIPGSTKPFNITGTKIQVDTSRLEEFGFALSDALGVPVSYEKMNAKMIEHMPYAGICWIDYNDTTITGKITNTRTFKKIVQYLKS